MAAVSQIVKKRPSSPDTQRLNVSHELLPHNIKKLKPTLDTFQKRERSQSLETRDPKRVQLNQITDGYIRPPVIPLDSLQRLYLLKKKQKWRKSNLYSIRSDQVNNSRSLVKYVEVSTQTDTIPELKSKSQITKQFATEEAEKKLSGVFSGAILYDQTEVGGDNNGDDRKSPIKFSNSKHSGGSSLPLTSTSLNALLNDKKKLVQVEVEETPANTSHSENPSEPVGPSAGFNFLDNIKVDESVTNSLSAKKNNKAEKLSFGLNKSSDTTKGSALPFSQPSDKPDSTPKFSFGSSNANDSPSLFGLSGERKSSKENAFSFGASKKDESKNDTSSKIKPAINSEKTSGLFSFGVADSNSDESIETKPKPFSFGANNSTKESTSTSFSFGNPIQSEDKLETKKPTSTGFSLDNTTKKDEPSITGFSLGNDKKEEKPALSFGQSSTSTNANFATAPVEKKEEAKPFNFSLGSSQSSNTNSTSKETASKPSFSFSQPAASEKSAESKQETPSLFGGSKPFSFGTNEQKTDDSNKRTLLSTTTETEENDAKKPTFSFGSTGTETSSAKPFSFGSTTSSGEAKPSFGTPKPSESESQDIAKPSFSFGGASSKPSFNFGAASLPSANTASSSSNKQQSSTATETKPSLFGQSTNTLFAPTPSTQSTFGDSNKAENSQPFSFGAASLPPKPETSQFGSSSTTTNPAAFPQANTGAASQPFSFGSTSTPTPPPASTPLFGQAQPATTNQTSGFNFGGASNPPLANSAFSFGASSTPAAPAPAGGFSTNFSFANTQQTDPSKIFGQQPSFGGANNGFGGGFGNAQPQGFGGNTPGVGGTPAGTPNGTPTIQSRVPGRKIAQMRTRRR